MVAAALAAVVAAAVPCAGACWEPTPTVAPWQIQLQGRVDSLGARIVEVDGQESTRAQVARFPRSLCYIDAGSVENFRPDADAFPREVIGRVYDGYPDERWLDIRRLDLLAAPLRARLDDCAAKGFDAVDPDNVNGFENDTGFPLTGADQLAFNRWLADEAHARGMAIALKNDGTQARELVAHFDLAVVESCFELRECGQYRPFVRAGKPVLAIEYRRRSERACSRARRLRFSVIFKRLDLGTRRVIC